MADVITVQGLREFQRSLKDMDANASKQLRVVNNSAAELVARVAAPKVPSRTGRARSTVKAKSTQLLARVSGGTKRINWFAWLDFGGRVGRKRSVRRTFMKGGRYLWPSYAENREQVQDILVTGMVELATSAGLEVTDG